MTCRHLELAEVMAAIVGEAHEPGARCPEVAAYRTRIHRELADESVVVTIRAELCDAHDTEARTDAGYGGSWIMRSPPVRANPHRN